MIELLQLCAHSHMRHQIGYNFLVFWIIDIFIDVVYISLVSLLLFASGSFLFAMLKYLTRFLCILLLLLLSSYTAFANYALDFLSVHSFLVLKIETQFL